MSLPLPFLLLFDVGVWCVCVYVVIVHIILLLFADLILRFRLYIVQYEMFVASLSLKVFRF